MARVFVALFFLGLVFAVLALISCLSAEDREVRGLPRIGWVLVILLFPLIGSLVYYFAGRPVKATPAQGTWRPGSGFPEATRPKPVLAPDDDPEFLRKIDNKRRREDEDHLRRWEEDLKKREDDLRKREDTPPADS